MASQVQIPFQGVILQEHSAPISCPTPNFAKGSPYNSRRLVSTSSMSRFIYIDGQDEQDGLERGFSVLSSTIAFSSTRIPKTAPKLMDHFKRTPDHRASQLPVQQLLVLFILFILSILSIDVP